MLSIGFVYDLRSDYLAQGLSEEETAEFDAEETIAAIASALALLGHRVERIGNLHQLVKRLGRGDTFDFVFNIAEGMGGLAREAQVPALLEGYGIPYSFSAPEVMIKCHDKSLAKQAVQAAGLQTPAFRVMRSPADIKSMDLPYPVFVKPIAEGTGKGISNQSLVNNSHEFNAQCQYLLSQFKQPVLVEAFLPGREFTVGLLGSGNQSSVLGVLEVVLGDNAEAVGHTFNNKENCEELVQYHIATDELAQRAGELAKNCWEALGGRDAGRIDIRCDSAGEPQFIEVNPLAGLHPTHSDLCILATKVGVSHEQLIDRIMSHALARYPQCKGKVDAHSCCV